MVTRPTQPAPAASIADRVFARLQTDILSLSLSPGSKISEADVAKDFGISRQPVRDAFHRLSKLGFLDIRPQRATTVSLISPQAILEARFFRTAVEVEMVRRATSILTDAGENELSKILDAQRDVVARGDTDAFKLLDDDFHQEICRLCGLGAVWDRIAENKAHTDRLRLLSIRDSSAQALEDHEAIMRAMIERDAEQAATLMRIHLDRIRGVLEDLQRHHLHWFVLDSPENTT